MLREVDPEFFSVEELNKPLPASHITVKDQPSREFLKQLHQYKCILSRLETYYNQYTGKQLPTDYIPNVVQLTSSKSGAEIIKFIKLIMVAAVMSEERKQMFISRIQKLEPEFQTIIMHIIGPVLEEEGSGVGGSAGDEATSITIEENSIDHYNNNAVRREIALEEEVARLLSERESNEELKHQLEQAKEENERLLQEQKKQQEEELIKPTQNNLLQPHIFDKNAPNNSDEYMSDLEAQIKNYEAKSKQDETSIRELTESLTIIQENKNSEIEHLRDKLRETEHICQRLQNIENVAERYKRKLQDQSDLERQVENLESENAKLRGDGIEEEEEGHPESHGDLKIKLQDTQELADHRLQTIETLQSELKNINQQKAPSADLNYSDDLSQKISHLRLVENLPEVEEIKTLLDDSTNHYEDLVRNYSQLILDKRELNRSVENLTNELELISGAWYSLASRVQQQNVAVTKKIYQSPKSWLSKQRQALDRIF